MTPITTFRMIRLLSVILLIMGIRQAFGLGADYRKGQPVGGNSAWPKGLQKLANATNRIHGFFVNAQDVFFYSGTADDFSEFLRAYSRIEGIRRHRLILHAGMGEAKSPWAREGSPCGWKLEGCPAAWRDVHDGMRLQTDTNYVLEAHFWMGGSIQVNQVAIPENVELAGDCLRNFQAITNGMTRAEVERRLQLDGGLQSASPVRYVDPACPGFKIRVEYDFKRDAAHQGRAIIGAKDTVIRVSQPCLEAPFGD